MRSYRQGFSPPDQEPNSLIKFPLVVLGYFLHLYNKLKEQLRVWWFNILQDISSLAIQREIVQHSSKLITYFLLLLVIFFFLDFFLLNTFNLNSGSRIVLSDLNTEDYKNFVKLILEVIIGAISAVLGLVFALYSVGFQTSTEKYSSDVTSYINEERVGNHFFGLLIFTDLFALFNLILLDITHEPPVLSLALTIILFVTSLLGIVIYKDHYITSLKPVSLYRRLFEELRLRVRDVNIYDSPRVNSFRLIRGKNIQSFKVYSTFHDSWTIIQAARQRASKFLNLGRSLFYDLLRRDNNYEDARYGPIFFANALQSYLSVKRYIDTEKAWWFPRKLESVSASDMTMYPIKASYEIRGLGPLHVEKPHLDWFEDRVLDFFKELHKNYVNDGNSKLLTSLIASYKLILTGDYSKNKLGGYEKSELGALENEEFSIFQSVLELFCRLYDAVKGNDELFTDYLNALFAINQVVIDNYPTEKVRSYVDSLVDDMGRITKRREEVIIESLPKLAREVVLDYFDRIEVEFLVEGKVITPKKWLSDEASRVYEEKLKLRRAEILSSLLSCTSRVLVSELQSKNWENVGNLVRIQFIGLNRLLYTKQWGSAKDLAHSFRDTSRLILQLPKNIVVQHELREEIEKGLLVALMERQIELFNYFLEQYLWVLMVLRHQEKDTDKIIRHVRIPLVLGGLVYLISEFDENPYYVTKLAKSLEEKFFVNGGMLQILKAANDIKGVLGMGESYRLTLEEATRFRHYYRAVINKIQDLPEDWSQEADEIGFSRTVLHPSLLIRRVGSWEYYDMSEAIDDFIVWLEKRAEIAKVACILDAKAKK